MDSLTARLMSRSGLNRADPTVPPTQNVRMVTLKEKYGPAEKALHDARAALEALRYAQKNSPDTVVNQVKWELYEAMEELQGREADFFASRYFGSGNKEILKGWKVDWKHDKFAGRIDRLETGALNRVTQAATLGREARMAASISLGLVRRLQAMDQAWGAHPRGPTPPNGIDTPFKDIQQGLKRIRTLVTEGSRGTTASTASLRASLRDAEITERLAQLVMKNRWDLPYDLR